MTAIIISVMLCCLAFEATGFVFNFPNIQSGYGGRQQHACPDRYSLKESAIRERGYSGEGQVCCYNAYLPLCRCADYLSCCPNYANRLICVNATKYQHTPTAAPYTLPPTAYTPPPTPYTPPPPPYTPPPTAYTPPLTAYTPPPTPYTAPPTAFTTTQSPSAAASTTKTAAPTTKAPVTTSKAPVSTSKAPVSTSKAPVSTSKAPVPVAVDRFSCATKLNTAPVLCDATVPYRTMDGSCNNLNHPEWGQSKQPLRRMVPADYNQDTDGEPRKASISGSDLPSTRRVSTVIHALIPATGLDSSVTHMQMLWGQYIDHDMSLTPLTDQTVKCCDSLGNHLSEGEITSENCIPITIPDDDISYNFTCMELVRSVGIPAGQCGMDTREQINNITPWIDGGAVYGTGEPAMKQLRAFVGGRLRVGQNNTLPTRPPGSKCMIPKDDPVQECFLAGDGRVNVWAGLTGMHASFVKEHNRIADSIYPIVTAMNPSYTNMMLDDTAFEETRRIIGAIHQVITYKEYLPGTLGPQAMTEYNLNLGSPNYLDTVMPQVANEFATAAFRFGHNEIPFSTIPVSKSFTATPLGSVIMEDMFHQPGMFSRMGHDNVMRGIISEPCKQANEKFTKSVRDNLFIKSSKNKAGLDLPSINNQRGREHGIPTYNRFRELCGLPVGSSFAQLPDFTQELKDSFANVYDNVNDIDLFSGGLAETNVEGGRVGPLFACMLGDQFQRQKDGDRFWFENTLEYTNPFTPSQISQLRNYSLAKMICNNHDLDMVPRNVFDLNSARVNCDSLPDLDLVSWLQ